MQLIKEKCQDSTSHHSSLTLGLGICTFLVMCALNITFWQYENLFSLKMQCFGTFLNVIIRTGSIFLTILRVASDCNRRNNNRKDFDVFLSQLELAIQRKTDIVIVLFRKIQFPWFHCFILNPLTILVVLVVGLIHVYTLFTR